MKFNFSKYFFSEATLKKPSVIFLIFTFCFSFWFVDFWRPWNSSKDESGFTWDAMHYYSYLPYKFCNNNSFEFNNGYTNFLAIGPKGTHLPKTTYGMSILYSPFFALGYKIAYNQKSPLNGFSEPFATCNYWGGIFYVMLGLVILRNFLKNFFNEIVTTITLIIVFFGTMLFYYTLCVNEMSHSYLFFLFTAFLSLTHKWHQQQKIIYSLLLGIVFGIISLVRPTEILIVLFFIFWNVKSINDFKLKLKFFVSNYIHILLIITICVLLWLPQFIFWKNQTGFYFYFSYPGERFFWNDPQIINSLFSYRKGWITYTPAVIMAFIGFFTIKKQFPVSKWVFIFLTSLFIYVLSCWWDWFFGGCFGARGFCQHIAYLSLPIAFFVDTVFFSNKSFLFKPLAVLLTTVFIVLCVFLNVGQTYQYGKNFIHFNAMNEKVYWKNFRQFKRIDEEFYWKNLSSPDYGKLMSGEDRDQ